MSIEQVPADVLAVVRRHLATATPPEDPIGHLATYDDEALIPIGTAITFRAGVNPQAYADRWWQVPVEIPEWQAGPSFSLIDVLDWQPDDTGGRLAAIVTDEQGRPWTTAWLFDGEPMRIRAVCLHEGPLPSRDHLLAQASGVLAQWGSNAAGNRRCLSPLGIAHHLHTYVDSLPLISLPEARFTCQNRGDCCQLDRWDIPITANPSVALSVVPWKDLRATPVVIDRSDKGYWRLTPTADGRCHARTEGSCSIHGTLGWQPIPTCRVFPLQFTATPDSIAVTASFTCLTVGNNHGAPLLAQGDDVQKRLRLTRQGLVTIPDPIRLWSGGPALRWEVYQDLEACLLDTLADRRRGDLAARVGACSHGMAHLIDAAKATGHCPEEPVTLLRAGMALPRQATPLAADMLMGRLLRDRIWEPIEARPFGGWLKSHWQLSRLGSIGSNRDDELATRYLRTVLFRKPGLGTGGVAFTWGVTAWIACLWDRQTVYQSRQNRTPVDRELQLDTARRLDHTLLNANITHLLDRDAVLRQMISNPATWLAFTVASG